MMMMMMMMIILRLVVTDHRQTNTQKSVRIEFFPLYIINIIIIIIIIIIIVHLLRRRVAFRVERPVRQQLAAGPGHAPAAIPWRTGHGLVTDWSRISQAPVTSTVTVHQGVAPRQAEKPSLVSPRRADGDR